MIDSKERARRDEAHALADMAWARSHRRSRTDGLGDLVRSIGAGRRTPAEVRRLRQQHHTQRLSATAIKSLEWSDKHNPWNPRSLDRSRYFPHQSERERTRGKRRAQAA